MQRAPWAAGLLLGVSLAILVTLVGPLLLFNPWFTSVLQARHGVADAFGTTPAEVNRVTGEILVDLYTDGAFDAAFEGGASLLDQRERSHMHDVSALVRLLAGVVLLAALMAMVTGVWLRHERRRVGRMMVIAAGAVGLTGLVLAGIFAVAFEQAFLAFHAIFFPPGTYLFERGSQLIELFPEGFWFDASLVAGGAVILSALVVTAFGLRWWRGPSATARHA